MGQTKRKEPPPSAEWRPRRFVSKKWDKRLEIVAIIASIPLVAAILLDLASIITQPQWDWGDLYHTATLVGPLALGAWFARMILIERRSKKNKQ